MAPLPLVETDQRVLCQVTLLLAVDRPVDLSALQVRLDHRENLRMPSGEIHGLDEQCARVAVADRLEKVAIPQNRAIFHGVLLVVLLRFFQQVVIKYIKRTLSSRACAHANNIFMENLM